MLAKLQASTLSPNIKTRIPDLLKCGQSEVHDKDPFRKAFPDTSRIAVICVLAQGGFHPLHHMDLWYAALALADLIFLVGELWSHGAIIHNDVSLGNVGSCISIHQVKLQKASLLKGAKEITTVLQDPGLTAADKLVALRDNDEKSGMPVGAFCDFGNARCASCSHDTVLPSEEERRRELKQTRSATYAFWSKADGDRHGRTHKGTTYAFTRHGPEDEVEAMMFVFLALASRRGDGRTAKKPGCRWPRR